MKLRIQLILLLIISFEGFSQTTGSVFGTVKDKNTQESLIGVTLQLEGTQLGAVTDLDGRFKIENISPGSYNIRVNFLGYVSQTLFNIVVTSGNSNEQNIQLETSSQNLKEVQITENTFGKRLESPLSIQSLSAEEIRNNAGGNYDISKVIQALPGVGGTGGNAARNDLIIRGGAPSENVYYLDGVEVPQINHFSTQGSSGGPQGILNVSFIEDVSLSTSSFASKYDNALSSVLQIRQREGNPEKAEGNIRLSSTELALSMEGPISKKTTYLASARRSYLQYFFQLIDLPIRPNYWDFQYKVTHKFNNKTSLTAIGLGAIDEFTFAVPQESDATKEYIIRSFPSINQWNYTVGFTLKHLFENGYYNLTISRNMFNNKLDQFADADYGNESKRTFRSNSNEIENKLRLDINKIVNDWKFSYGASVQYVKYNNDLFAKVANEVLDSNEAVISPAVFTGFNTAIDFVKYGAFGSVSKKLFEEKLSLTLGVRFDFNSFPVTEIYFEESFSPRFTASYSITPKVNINATVGRYIKIPSYTILGYRNAVGDLLNSRTQNIICDHLAGGFEFLPTSSLRITVEGFYKRYDNYPVSRVTGISLANLGNDFGVIGNEWVVSAGKGRSYGTELFIQQKLTKDYYITASYTFFYSKFSDSFYNYTPSSWDSRNLISLIAGKKFKKGWELGLKYRLSGGAPYTPYDLVESQRTYTITGQGVSDYSKLNSERLPTFNQLDVRIDKKYNFKRTSLNIYLDFQNALMSKSVAKDYYTFKRNADNTAFETTDGKPLKADGSNAIPILLENVDENFTPALGVIFQF
jgi:TonB dependent receptor/CarboxypepD_reg-like domain/TonB-dependent Receptor Plug Domain